MSPSRLARLGALFAVALGGTVALAAGGAAAPLQQAPLAPLAGVEASAGLRVETVTPGGLGALAGLQPGDLLLGWCRATEAGGPCLAEGELAAPLDLEEVETEQIPRGGVRLRGRRGDVPQAWDLFPGYLRLGLRPLLPPTLEALDRQASDLLAQGAAAGAVVVWHRGAVEAGPAGSRLSLWFLWHAADALNAARQVDFANTLYDEALVAAEAHGDRAAAARLFFVRGRQRHERGAFAEAAVLYAKALALARSLAPESLAEAAVLHNRCALDGEPDPTTLCLKALAIRERLAPRSFAVSNTLNVLANQAVARADRELAEGYFKRAATLEAAIAPISLESVWTIQNASAFAVQSGDLETAEDLLERARRFFEEVDPAGANLSTVLNSLAALNAKRGDVEAAEDLFRRSLLLEEALDPASLAVALRLGNLAELAVAHGNLAAAEGYARRALTLSESLGAEEAGARACTTLGNVASERGDLPLARRFLQRSLAYWRKNRLWSVEGAEVLRGLGRVALRRGELAAAESDLRQSLEILDRRAPESEDRALVLKDLGELERRRGRVRSAAERSCAAVATLETVWSRLGRGDRSAFGSEAADFYADCIAARLRLGQKAEAFRLLERGRARAFLERLAKRDLLATSDLPPALAAERRSLDGAYDGAQGELSALAPGGESASEAVRLRSRLLDLRAQQDDLRARIERASPRYAALHAPHTLDLAGVRAALDPGTVLLAYQVETARSHLFVVRPATARGGSGLTVYTLPLGAEALGRAVARFRGLLQNPASERQAIERQALQLYDLLLRPAERQLASAKRLLLSPDGPLQTLPFAALMRRQGGRTQFLVEWKPLHTVLSATVYAELGKRRRANPDTAPPTLAAFGDPVPLRLSEGAAGVGGGERTEAAAGVEDGERSEGAAGVPGGEAGETAAAIAPEILAVLRGAFALGPLPSSRQEVEGLAALYPGARTFLGPEATEERAKAVAPGARLLHFACHGTLDERSPLDSALVLSPPLPGELGRENGLLQAWEIAEGLHLDADLVTLSACSSALGRDSGSEGLVGLTRAFQIAGARSVLASLWSVADASTAELMRRFYGALREGKTKDEALRQAQMALIQSPEHSHPNAWAAFQLSGDWR